MKIFSHPCPLLLFLLLFLLLSTSIPLYAASPDSDAQLDGKTVPETDITAPSLTPETSVAPSAPEAGGVPDVSGVSSTPETNAEPEASSTPSTPEASATPDASADPSQSSSSPDPEASNTPSTPDAGVAPGVSAAPDSSASGENPVPAPPPAAVPSPVIPPRPVFQAEKTLPLWGKVQKDLLTPPARAAVLLEALSKAANALRAYTAVNIGVEDSRQRLALALAVHTVEFSGEIVPGSPYDTMIVKAVLAPVPEGLEAALPKALSDTNMRAWRKAALAFIIPRAAEAMDLARRAFESRSVQIFYDRLEFLSAQADAWLILNESWQNGTGPREALNLERKALEIDRDNPIIWASAGSNLLLLDQPLEAISSLESALALNPDLSQALYLRGIAHMRLHQLALAESDFSQALKLEPGNPEWLRARGAVRMLKEDYASMCKDFFEACSLGDCEGLALARKRGLCQTQ